MAITEHTAPIGWHHQVSDMTAWELFLHLHGWNIATIIGAYVIARALLPIFLKGK